MKNTADYLLGRRYRGTGVDFSVIGIDPNAVRGVRVHGTDGTKRWISMAAFTGLVMSGAWVEVALLALVLDRDVELKGWAK